MIPPDPAGSGMLGEGTTNDGCDQMLVEDIQGLLEELAPIHLAAGWDNTGLEVGRGTREVKRILVTMDVTEDVVREAEQGDYQVILSHHPLLFTPLYRVTDGDRRGRIVGRLLAADIAAISCHTNLDAAEGGLAEIAAGELGVVCTYPVLRTPVAGVKLVGFIPTESYDEVVSAAYAEGAGVIGEYSECSYNLEGEGTFLPGAGADPYVGVKGERERAKEIRWETVVPRKRLASVIQAFVQHHPYEEPAFDIYPLENVGSSEGLGRIGKLRAPTTVGRLAKTVGRMLGLGTVAHTGDPGRTVDRVVVIPGSGGELLTEACGKAEVAITGDVKYHDAEKAETLGIDVIVAPHGHLEAWAMRAWAAGLGDTLARRGVEVTFADAGGSRWSAVQVEANDWAEGAGAGARTQNVVTGGEEDSPLVELGENGDESYAVVDDTYSLFVDGGSRGNPGPAAIGAVLADGAGEVLEEVSDRIGDSSNNVAEYQALITGLETALDRGVRILEVFSDSELMVRQMNREYKVRNEQLKELFMQATALTQQFPKIRIRHVHREQNMDADTLVNRALDEG